MDERITPEQAKAAAQRLINSHFHNDDLLLMDYINHDERITPEQAKAAAQRLINSYFHNDDLLLMDYINQQEEVRKELLEACEIGLRAAALYGGGWKLTRIRAAIARAKGEA